MWSAAQTGRVVGRLDFVSNCFQVGFDQHRNIITQESNSDCFAKFHQLYWISNVSFLILVHVEAIFFVVKSLITILNDI